MGSEKVEDTTESIQSSYRSLISDASQILDTLSSVWRICVSAIAISLSAIGILSFSFYFAFSSKLAFLIEGIVFLAIAAWILLRNTRGACGNCCRADIPKWKGILASFVRSDDSIEIQKDGQSVIENLIKVTFAADEWISQIKREIFSILFWPFLISLIFFFTLYPASLTEIRIVELAFIIYALILVISVYTLIKRKFRNWQFRIKRFKEYTTLALETI